MAESSSKYVVEDSGMPIDRRRQASMRTFIWNKEKKTFLDRSGINWAKIGLFYLVFFSCLALFMFALMKAALSTVQEDVPSLSGSSQDIFQMPGMGMRPLKHDDYDTTTQYATPIKFKKSDAASYKTYTDQMKAYLDSYTAASEVFTSCGGTATKVCPFNVTELGACSGSNTTFGFSTGKPCVLLKLNKLYGWEPTAYTADPNPETFEDFVFAKTQYNASNVGVSCQAYTEKRDIPRVDFNGTLISFFPSGSGGFPFSCFPFCGKKTNAAYRAPIIAARFDVNSFADKKIFFWCRAWAKNINNGHFSSGETGAVTATDQTWYSTARTDRSGSIRFSLCMYSSSSAVCDA